MRLTGDRTEPENELLAWLRSAYGVVSFTGTSAIPAEILMLHLFSIDSLSSIGIRLFSPSGTFWLLYDTVDESMREKSVIAEL